jgi:hypothetical protein
VATVTGVIGDGEADDEGRVVSREMVVNKTIEGEMTLSMRRAISVVECVAVNIVVVGVVTRLSSKMKGRERKEERKKKTKEENVRPERDDLDDAQGRESRAKGYLWSLYLYYFCRGDQLLHP